MAAKAQASRRHLEGDGAAAGAGGDGFEPAGGVGAPGVGPGAGDEVGPDGEPRLAVAVHRRHGLAEREWIGGFGGGGAVFGGVEVEHLDLEEVVAQSGHLGFGVVDPGDVGLDHGFAAGEQLGALALVGGGLEFERAELGAQGLGAVAVEGFDVGGGGQ